WLWAHHVKLLSGNGRPDPKLPQEPDAGLEEPVPRGRRIEGCGYGLCRQRSRRIQTCQSRNFSARNGRRTQGTGLRRRKADDDTAWRRNCGGIHHHPQQVRRFPLFFPERRGDNSRNPSLSPGRTLRRNLPRITGKEIRGILTTMLKILRKLARIFVCVACTKMKPQMNTDPCSSVVSFVVVVATGLRRGIRGRVFLW